MATIMQMRSNFTICNIFMQYTSGVNFIRICWILTEIWHTPVFDQPLPLSRTRFGLSCRPRLSSVLIHMKLFFITNVDCVVCNKNYNYVSWLNMRLLLSRTLIVLSVNIMIIMPPVWLLLSMLPLFQTFIIDYNYAYEGFTSLPIIYELFLQYLVRNEIRISAQIKIV